EPIEALELMRLADAGEKILTALGVERGESKLDSLFDTIDLARGAALFERGEWEKALWLFAGIRRESRARDPAKVQRFAVETARCHLRLGDAAAARLLASEALATCELTITSHDAALIGTLATRLAGDARGLAEAMRRLSATTAPRQAARWELHKCR